MTSIKTFATALLSGLLVSRSVRANEPFMDGTVSASALLTNHSAKDGVRRDASNSGGFLASYRYYLSPWAALEFNFGRSNESHRVNSASGTSIISSSDNEVSADFVVRIPMRPYVTPFVLLGVGSMRYSPDVATFQGARTNSQNRTAGLYGLGVDWELAPRWSLRMQYRGLFNTAPTFDLKGFQTNTYLHTAEPSIGVTYQFR